jgi:hypothetical protein
MTRPNPLWQALALLLVSGVLAFAQATDMGLPASPMQWPVGPTYPPPPAEPGPGTINYVEGQVSLDGQLLSARSIGTARLKPGQSLETAEGYVEVLLTPGAFLRIGHNSEVRIYSAGLVESQVQLARGSALLEVDQFIPGASLGVVMGGATTQIRKNGLYGFDSTRQTVMVVDGQATVQEAGGTATLDKHHQVQLAANQPLKKRRVKLKDIEADPLFAWSQARSEDVAQASSSAAATASAYAAASPGWFWDPTWNSYGFWPYADSAYSVFGWNFFSPGYFGFSFYGGGGAYYTGGHSGWHWHGHGTGGSGSHGGGHSHTGGGHAGGGHSGGSHSGGGHAGGGGHSGGGGGHH